MDMTTQVIKIIEWADEKGIGKDGFVEMQLTKSTEENAELQHAIAKNEVNRKLTGADITEDNLLDIKDAIGDIFVTLVTSVYAQLKDKDLVLKTFSRACKENYSLHKYSINDIILYAKRYDADFWYNRVQYAGGNNLTLYHYIKFLRKVAHTYNTYLTDCVELAYNTIKNRQGKTVNGEFVKD